MPLLYIKTALLYWHQENAKNGISERLDFKIFWGNMPPDPRKSSRLWRFRNCLGYQQKSGYGPDTMMLFNEKKKDSSVG